MLLSVCRQENMLHRTGCRVLQSRHMLRQSCHQHSHWLCLSNARHGRVVVDDSSSTTFYTIVRCCDRPQRRFYRSSGPYDSTNNTNGLQEIGRFIDEKSPDTSYTPGQFFIHRRMGYRGVITFPWRSHLVAYPERNISTDDTGPDYKIRRPEDAGPPDSVQLYQVMCDVRDTSEKRNFMATQTFTWNSGVLEGVDYVFHDNIVPYLPSASSRPLLQHFLFPKLFAASLVPNEADEPVLSVTPMTEAMSSWEKAHVQGLSNSSVYRACTHGVEVTVIPFYAGKRVSYGAAKPHTWFYKVHIENKSDSVLQLVGRSWHTITAKDEHEHNEGRGVMRQFPLLTPRNTTFQYLSTVSLPTSSGLMGGVFTFVDLFPGGKRGQPFACEIPTFSLCSDRSQDAEP